jgi:hypothetical protein
MFLLPFFFGAQYAGNVLVYWPGSPLHGDWFGGVLPDNAASFRSALLSSKVRRGGGQMLARPQPGLAWALQAAYCFHEAHDEGRRWLRAASAPQSYLRCAQAEAGGAGDKALRRWWRGRVGLGKEEQLARHQAAGKDIEDL